MDWRWIVALAIICASYVGIAWAEAWRDVRSRDDE